MGATWMMIVGVTLSVFAVIGAGTAARRAGWLNEEADRSLLKLIINLLLPCLIFTASVDNPALKDAGNLIFAPIIGCGTLVLGLVAAALVTRLGHPVTGLADSPQRRTFALAVGVYNYGFLPIPLVRILFGEEALGVLFVHNVGLGLGLWTFGILLLSGSRTQNVPATEQNGVSCEASSPAEGPRNPNRGWWREMINPPSVAVVVAVVCNFLNVTSNLPEGLSFLLLPIKWLGEAAVPMSLLLVGATMADLLRPNGEGPTRVDRAKVIGWSCLLRLGLLPVAFLAVAMLVPVSRELQAVLVIQAAMPSAVFPVLLARHYGGNPGTALLVVLSTSLVSLVTIPLWILAGISWLGIPAGM